jgi:flagellar hook assembly protein FlgD
LDFTILSLDDKPAQAKNSPVWNYPNPFSYQTTIGYSIPSEAYVSINIMNSRGESITTLFRGMAGKGRHSLTWDGTVNNGTTAAPGLYFIRIICGDKSYSSKVVKN